jgi:imidazolonepropionase-like amidohydrolase
VVAAKVDVLAHTVPRAVLSAADLAAIVGANVALIPTLMLWEHLTRHERASVQARVVEAELAQLRAFREAGGTVLFGTDHGAVDSDPTREYYLMHEAGMRFGEILESLTTAPTRRFAEKCAGTIAPGESADLVVLDGPVSRGPALFSDVRLTIRAGRIIYTRG